MNAERKTGCISPSRIVNNLLRLCKKKNARTTKRNENFQKRHCRCKGLYVTVTCTLCCSAWALNWVTHVHGRNWTEGIWGEGTSDLSCRACVSIYKHFWIIVYSFLITVSVNPAIERKYQSVYLDRKIKSRKPRTDIARYSFVIRAVQLCK
jgi:hypothetical protein